MGLPLKGCLDGYGLDLLRLRLNKLLRWHVGSGGNRIGR
jgi:hypothetical protein